MVMSEISTNITEDELKMPVVVKGIRNYRYTFEVYGYGHYRIIGRKKLK